MDFPVNIFGEVFSNSLILLSTYSLLFSKTKKCFASWSQRTLVQMMSLQWYWRKSNWHSGKWASGCVEGAKGFRCFSSLLAQSMSADFQIDNSLDREVQGSFKTTLFIDGTIFSMAKAIPTRTSSAPDQRYVILFTLRCALNHGYTPIRWIILPQGLAKLDFLCVVIWLIDQTVSSASRAVLTTQTWRYGNKNDEHLRSDRNHATR